MIIRHPETKDIPQLKNLWREAFNDEASYIDQFFLSTYDKNHAMVVEHNEKIATMLYWFDCDFNDGNVAYIYAVATLNEFKQQGFCKCLMEALHKHLKALGYMGACLTPSSEYLFKFYGKMGYLTCIYNDETEVYPKAENVPFKKISMEEYFRFRKDFLPKNCITQRVNDFLNYQIDFFKGEDFIFALRNDEFFIVEFFGNKDAQPYIVFNQNAEKGVFRTFGKKTPFAMYLPFKDSILPEYLDFAYD